MLIFYDDESLALFLIIIRVIKLRRGGQGMCHDGEEEYIHGYGKAT
jgi:hypothetical protein